MKDEDVRDAAQTLVATYKASGLSMEEIGSVLFQALACVVKDQDTSEGTVRIISTALGLER